METIHVQNIPMNHNLLSQYSPVHFLSLRPDILIRGDVMDVDVDMEHTQMQQ